MSFEKEYYEAPEFWSNGMVSDPANTARIHATINIIPNATKSLLDVGCGNGVFPNLLAQKRPDLKITATDRSKEALKYVETEKFESNITSIPLEDKSFDCVTCLQVLEHIPYNEYTKSLSELARVSSKYLIISIPFEENLLVGFTQCPACYAQFNSDLHLRNYNINTMQTLFSEYGFTIKQSTNVGEGEKYWGVEYYSKLRNLFGKAPIKRFNSPICPICGYRNTKFTTSGNSEDEFRSRAKKNNAIKDFLRVIWPKVKTQGYWLIALYERH